MSFQLQPNGKPVEALLTGNFYGVQRVSRCFLIQEAEHFKQTVQTEFWAYLDQEGNLNHFHLLTSRLPAKTTFAELLSIKNLQKITFFEGISLSSEILQNKSSLPLDSANQLKKLVDYFSPQTSKDQGSTFLVKDLKKRYLPEYFESLELH